MYCVIDLPRLNTLTIRNAILSDDSEYRQVTQFLFDRQASRFQAIALQLQRCDRSWQQVVSQLEASGLVSSATCI
jgi:division protein CdvB (Snf7/Vps24/ESCRT-III family)